VSNQSYTKYLNTTKASAVVLDPDTVFDRLPVLRHTNPYLTFARIIDFFYPEKRLVDPGIDASSVVDDSATIHPDTGIGPLCTIGSSSRIDSGCQLISNIGIGRNVILGKGCLLYPGVCILDDCKVGNNVIIHAGTVIGSDGFGFAKSDSGLRKIKQIGWVEIGDDVEIGSNSSVDRGAIGPTRIGAGTKIDNLVQIAHNVQNGRHCIIVSQVGISGSAKIGDGVILAGQAGIVGHLEIGDGAIVAAQSGVPRSVEPGKTVLGSPARDIGEARRIEASLSRLPDLFKRVRKLEKKQSEDD